MCVSECSTGTDHNTNNGYRSLSAYWAVGTTLPLQRDKKCRGWKWGRQKHHPGSLGGPKALSSLPNSLSSVLGNVGAGGQPAVWHTEDGRRPAVSVQRRGWENVWLGAPQHNQEPWKATTCGGKLG